LEAELLILLANGLNGVPAIEVGEITWDLGGLNPD
jgi:hypothetical protein